MKKQHLLPLCLAISSYSHRSFAQKAIYLDTQIGGQYAYAEGAHFGLGKTPFKGHNFLITPFVAPMLRLQINNQLGVSAGYSGGGLGWGYKLQVPKAISNGSYGGTYSGSASSVYLDRIPLLFNYKIKQYNFKEIDTSKELYVYSMKIDLMIGGGVNYVRGLCETCNLGAGVVSPQDTIVFRQQPIISRKWGGYITAGAVTRFYRLGKERFNLTFFLNQGLTTMMDVPVQYTYNSRRGSIRLKVRGSGVGLLAAIPIRLKAYNR